MTTVPTPIVDKNGKLTTVHKKFGYGAATRLLPTPEKNFVPSGSKIETSALAKRLAAFDYGTDSFNHIEAGLKDHFYETHGSGAYSEESGELIANAVFPKGHASSYARVQTDYRDLSAIMLASLYDDTEHSSLPADQKLDADMALKTHDANITNRAPHPNITRTIDSQFVNHLIDDKSPGVGELTARQLASFVFKNGEQSGHTYDAMSKQYDVLISTLNKFRENEKED